MLLEAVLAIPRGGGGGTQGEIRKCKGDREELKMYDKKVYCACKGYRSLMARKEVDLKEL